MSDGLDAEVAPSEMHDKIQSALVGCFGKDIAQIFEAEYQRGSVLDAGHRGSSVAGLMANQGWGHEQIEAYRIADAMLESIKTYVTGRAQAQPESGSGDPTGSV